MMSVLRESNVESQQIVPGDMAHDRKAGDGVCSNEELERLVLERTRKLEEANEALRFSEERYQALIEASTQVLYRMSPDWSEMRQLKGGSFLADTEKPNSNWLQEYIHPDDQKWVLEVIGNAVRTGTIFELEHRVRRIDGTLGWTYSRAVPVRNDSGEVVEWFGAASDITERKRMEEDLRESAESLSETNAALRVLLKQRERDKTDLEESILTNLRHLVNPYLEKLKKSSLSNAQATWVGILENHLAELTHSFSRTLLFHHASLTPTELRVAAMVRDGKPTKEIAETLCTSERTVTVHRDNIREKLGLRGKKANLRSHLLNFTERTP